MKGFWIDFGEVLERFFDIILILLSYYYAYRIGKDFGLDFEVILIVFEVIFDSFLNDFGGHIGMILIIF